MEALELWPQKTEAAMEQGCLQAMAGAVMQAITALPVPAAQSQQWAVWLTGGDGPRLAELLPRSGLRLQLAPNLCLEAMAALAFS